VAARSNNDDWEAIEAAVRAALVDSGLGDLVREVDAAADTSEDEGGAGQRAAYAPRRVFELLAASEGFFAGRAALARSAGQLTDRLGVERLRFVDNDGRKTSMPRPTRKPLLSTSRPRSVCAS